METSIIRLEGVEKSYYLTDGQEIPVLKGIDAEIRKGEFVALMGESGSGKSTLLNILGFLHAPTKGRYFLEGEDLSDLNSEDALSYVRNRKLGFIFQQFHLIPKLTALENVLLPSLYLAVSEAEKRSRAEELLRKVGLSGKMQNRPGELSG